eukprot:1366670-Prorocentrum_lima.AAC.1
MWPTGWQCGWMNHRPALQPHGWGFALPEQQRTLPPDVFRWQTPEALLHLLPRFVVLAIVYCAFRR